MTGNRRLLIGLFWIIFVLMIVNMAVMMAWSIPTLQQMAGGLDPFDMRSTGYSFDEAKALLTALGDNGAAFYENVQHLLDLSFPALMALSVSLAIYLLAPIKWGLWRVLLALLPFAGAILDYMENASVTALLSTGPDAITPEQVATASGYTLLKTQAISAGLLVMVVLLLYWLWRWLAARRKPA